MRVVVCCPDLLLRSRILAACRDAAVVPVVLAPPALPDAAQPGDLALVDLDAAGALGAVAAAVARGARVVGFAGHLDVARLEAAAKSGAEPMARGAFVQRLPSLVRGGS